MRSGSHLVETGRRYSLWSIDLFMWPKGYPLSLLRCKQYYVEHWTDNNQMLSRGNDTWAEGTISRMLGGYQQRWIKIAVCAGLQNPWEVLLKETCMSEMYYSSSKVGRCRHHDICCSIWDYHLFHYYSLRLDDRDTLVSTEVNKTDVIWYYVWSMRCLIGS